MKVIKLNFKDRSIISLSGRLFGIEIYEKQIENEIKNETEIILEFPPQILSIASSFAQGILSSEVESLGLDNVKKKFTIHSDVSGFEESFWESFD